MLVALEPYACGRYLNFSERPLPASAFFDAATLDRLRAAKAAWDPSDLIVTGHPLGG